MLSTFFSLILVVIQLGGFQNKIQLKAVVQHETAEVETEENSVYEWQVRIPKIGLIAPIKDGTNQEVLNEFVGHFEETEKQKGNVGLAAHNRGYPVNYFEKINLLEIGDEIYYLYKGIEIKYVVSFKEIIEETNWNYLNNTENNRITLITCIENQPKYRLCVQAEEMKKDSIK